MAVTLSALRYLPGPDIGPELLRSARFYDIVIRGGRWDRSECLQKMLWWTDGKGTYGRSHKTKVVYRITLLFLVIRKNVYFYNFLLKQCGVLKNDI